MRSLVGFSSHWLDKSRFTPPPSIRWLFWGCLALIVGGCGRVITLTPTPTPEPTPTISLALAQATTVASPTPAPYTPAPTPTPTLTPTPVIHTIVVGESLLSVAEQYGVSVAALQDANGILDPRTLQIGQQIVIPRPDELEESAGGDATPTATPLPASVQNVLLGPTTLGGLWALGEVQNDTDVPLEQVRVGITLVDAQGVDVAAVDGLVALDLVEARGHAPFALLIEKAPSHFDQYRTTVLAAVPAYIGSYYRDLEVRNLESEGERYASYTVTGSIFNVGPEEAVGVQVVLTAYDPLNRVIAMRKVDPEHNVVPRGGETTFAGVLTPLGGPVDRIEAVAQGARLTPTP